MTSNAQGLLFDSNVWVALTFPTHGLHLTATSVLENCVKTSTALFCRSTQQSFLRLITTATLARTYGSATIDNRQAIQIFTDLHQLPYVGFESEPAGTNDLWLKLADRNTASPKLWMDAYLAAFAISGQLRFVTADKDFRQFQASGLDLHLLKSQL